MDEKRFQELLNKETLTLEEKKELETFLNEMKKCSFKG
jgi:hypothetical protein